MFVTISMSAFLVLAFALIVLFFIVLGLGLRHLQYRSYVKRHAPLTDHAAKMSKGVSHA